MGKYLKKRRADGELAALEPAELLGIRDRAVKEEGVGVSSKRRKTAAAAVAESAEFAGGYLQLRSRRVCMSSRIERSRGISGGPTSRCSGNASCELGEPFDKAATCYAPSRETLDEARDSEPTMESDPTKRRHVVAAATPTEAEIEEFFAAAERDEWQRFATKYNFDVVDDVPLAAGRYEWVPLLVIQ